MVSKIDFAILTALKDERDAVLRAFGFTAKDRIRNKKKRTYWCGRLKFKTGEFYQIIVSQSLDQANVAAALLANDTIHDWAPGAMLLVGIAGAASEEQKPGDLVIGRHTYYYERKKMTPDGTKPEPYTIPANAMLLDRVLAVPKWSSRRRRPDGTKDQPNIHDGVIAVGEKVIAAAAIRDDLASLHRKIKAVEMEGYGFSQAAWQSFDQVPHLVIKAIQDSADANKNDEWRQYAAGVAAAYAKHFLRDRPLPPRNPPSPNHYLNHAEEINPHYQQIVGAFENGMLIPFLGAGVNLYARLPMPNGSANQYSLSDIELSSFLIEKIKKNLQSGNKKYSNELIGELIRIPCLLCYTDLANRPKDCPIIDRIQQISNSSENQVFNCPLALEQRLAVAKMNVRFLSQHLKLMTNPANLYKTTASIFEEHSKPNSLHYFLVEIYKKISQSVSAPKYQLFVTTNYDTLLEKAFRRAEQPFEVVFYVAEGTQRGKFKYQKSEWKESRVIRDPNKYRPPDDKRAVILKLYGSLEDKFVITEDQHLDYLVKDIFEQGVPTELLSTLKDQSILFLGFNLNDYDLRLLHQSWEKRLFSGQSWLIHQSKPGDRRVEKKVWTQRNIETIEATLEGFITQLAKGLGLEELLAQLDGRTD